MTYLALIIIMLNPIKGNMWLPPKSFEVVGIGPGGGSDYKKGIVYHRRIIYNFTKNWSFKQNGIGLFIAKNLNNPFSKSANHGYIHYAETGIGLKLNLNYMNYIIGIGLSERYRGLNHFAQLDVLGDVVSLVSHNQTTYLVSSIMILSGFLWDLVEHFSKKDRLALKFGFSSFMEANILNFDKWGLGLGITRSFYKGDLRDYNGHFSFYYSFE